MILSVGAVDTSIDVRVFNDAGLPVTGLVAATFPSVTASKGTGADTTLELVDLAALDSEHADGGVKERGEGVYRLDLPDAVAAAAGVVTLRGEASDKRLIAPEILVGPSDLVSIRKLLEADLKVDKAVTPWAMVFYEKGTATELLRKQIKDVDGGNITSVAVVPGQFV